MSFITIDFETFYDNDTGFKHQNTEEYINDIRFHAIGVGIKVDDGETKWFAGSDIQPALDSIDWGSAAILCHNAMFDAAILSWVYNIRPAYIFDTLSMARAIHGVDAGGSLAALAQRYVLGTKGTEVVNAFGKGYHDFTPEELAAYGEYCINDVELTYALFDELATGFPQTEFDLIDMTTRMFTEPRLRLNDALLVERLDDVRAEKQALLAGLIAELSCDNEESVRKKMSSNKQFAEILAARGVVVPMKTSPATGKDAPALAKTDEGFLALQEHEDPVVQQLCAVRLGTKSTIEESRLERFINIGARNEGLLPIPLKYYGAHTGRWSGQDGINMQNLPSRDKYKKTLKNAIIPPDDHVIINCDSSQIEARVLAWWAGQQDLVSAFGDGRDVYCEFASKVYKRIISKGDPIERFVGKTCILGLGYGTGAEKLRHTLKTQPPGADLPLDECKSIVSLYRSTNTDITELWRECDLALEAMMGGVSRPFTLGKHGCVVVNKEGIRLPNGLYIRYNKLRLDENGKKIYISRRGDVGIWGGAVVENVVQALARIIVGEQMVQLANIGLRPVLTVHDAAVCVVPEKDAADAVEVLKAVMSTPPDWCASLPVACEAKFGQSYGEC